MTLWMTVAIELLLVAVVVVLGMNPRWRLSCFMFRSRGPRGDVERLTRRQLFAEGTKYLYIAVLCFLAMWLLQAASDAFGWEAAGGALAGGALFVTAIFMGMAVLAGA